MSGEFDMEGVMTFREKSAVITILALLLTYGAYAARVKLGGPMDTGEAVAFLSGVIVVQAIIMIVAHLVVALARRPERRDERDEVAELRGTRNGYFALATGVVATMWLAIIGAPTLTVLNGLLGALVAAEVVRYAFQLIYYRTGV
jgi:purine-cytosine permease-like protein